MGSDAEIPHGQPARDLVRKKKTNRSARLKQCKREQWHSQGGSDNVIISADTSTEGAAEGRHRGVPIGIPISGPWGNPPEADCSGSSSDSGSGSITDAENGGDRGALDDWEAVADALTVDDAPERKDSGENAASAAVEKRRGRDRDPARGILRTPSDSSLGLRAWEPDDASRPECLPNLSKQNVPRPENRTAKHGDSTGGWLCRSFDFQPLICPICYEQFDSTDTSFFPCPCGFRLCLFCHNRILGEDGRCPGCREQYGSITGDETSEVIGLPLQYNRLSHSHSRNERP